MGPIRVLAPQVADKIAAGEVIVRPAAAVKELVENALDAGARTITVELEEGGRRLLRVTDDGCGMAPEEAPLSLKRHATSKLASEDDLLAVSTLGFRGEALPSIAAVSRLTLTTRPAASPAGLRLVVLAGEIEASTPRAAAPGTQVEVAEIFFNLPARRKFLKSKEAEQAQIVEVLRHLALAYPEVQFLLKNPRTLLSAPGPQSLAERVASLYGPELAARLLPVSMGQGPLAVTGLVTDPDFTLATNRFQVLLVNRRVVQDKILGAVLRETYAGLLPRGRHPGAVLAVKIPPELVDVNVHPAKAEVRLPRENEVFVALQRAVRQAVLEQAPLPTAAAPPAGPLAGAGPEPATSPLWERGVLVEAQARAVAAAAPPRVSLPLLRVLGQVANTFIVAEGPDGMYLIDQHAAHERVLFEETCAARHRQDVHVQGLLEPALAELSPRQEEVLLGHRETLAEHGFQLEPFGERAYRIGAIPALLAGRDAAQALVELLDALAEETPEPSADRVAATLACHAAVRAGQSLTQEEMRELVRRLEQTEAPHTCPHGRPTTVHLSGSWLAQTFRRR